MSCSFLISEHPEKQFLLHLWIGFTGPMLTNLIKRLIWWPTGALFLMELLSRLAFGDQSPCLYLRTPSISSESEHSRWSTRTGSFLLFPRNHSGREENTLLCVPPCRPWELSWMTVSTSCLKSSWSETLTWGRPVWFRISGQGFSRRNSRTPLEWILVSGPWTLRGTKLRLVLLCVCVCVCRHVSVNTEHHPPYTQTHTFWTFLSTCNSWKQIQKSILKCREHNNWNSQKSIFNMSFKMTEGKKNYNFLHWFSNIWIKSEKYTFIPLKSLNCLS